MKSEMDYIQEKPVGQSNQNEPENNFFITSNIRRYPDMRTLYGVFRKKIGLDDSRCIVLGNGFEGVFRSTLIAIRPKTMFFNVPQWKMVGIVCDQLGIEKVTSGYIFDSGMFHQESIEKCECAYFTVHNGPLFHHDDIDVAVLSKLYKYVILDVSYCSIKEISKYLNVRFQNVFVIGSFDKIYGCGLRLGFCSFDETYVERMMLCRERYISSQSERFILDNEFVQPTYAYNEFIYGEFRDIIISYCFNYITVVDNGQQSISNNRKFSVGEHKFIRYGIPSNPTEYLNLRQDLANARDSIGKS